MRDIDSQCRITRVVDGEDHEVQLAQLQAVMHRIQGALRTLSYEMPAAQRTYIGNALLNLAVTRILGEEGSHRTATLLMRLSDVVHAHPMPPESPQADLGALHG